MAWMGNEKRGRRFFGRSCVRARLGKGKKRVKKERKIFLPECLFKSNVNYAKSDSFFPLNAVLVVVVVVVVVAAVLKTEV